ncbi:MAG: hypothetical protein WC045_02180 [Patescibacteria group bacterium]
MKKILSILFVLTLILAPFQKSEAATKAYDYSYVEQSSYPTLKVGESTILWVKIKNTGTATWSQNDFRLGTSHDKDRPFDFIPSTKCDLDYKCYQHVEGTKSIGYGPNWVGVHANRIRMDQVSVRPGEVASFGFYVTAPNTTTGSYRKYFQPVVDGKEWLKDIGLYWDIKVNNLSSENQSSSTEDGLNINIHVPLFSLDSNKVSVVSGETAQLNWDATGYESCSLDNGIGAVQLIGSYTTPVITSNKKYTITCKLGQTTAAPYVEILVQDPSFTPQPPTGLTVTGNESYPASVAWNYAEGRTTIAGAPNQGYIIYELAISDSPDFPEGRTMVMQDSFNHELLLSDSYQAERGTNFGLQEGKTHYFKVRYRNVFNKWSAFSSTVSATIPPVKFSQ